VLNTLQGDETSNRVFEEIVSMPSRRFHEELLAELIQMGKLHEPTVTWKASTVQLFTPNAAKGYCRMKPDSTGRNDKTKDQWTDPFLEWLRYRGYFVAACPFFQGSKGENIRLLCPVPAGITFEALRRATSEVLRTGVYGRSPKLDSLAVLRLAELLIQHSEDFRDPDAEPYDDLYINDKTPADLVSGVRVTHYQSMGSSKAVSAMSIMALPGWFRIQSYQDAQDWLAILREHQRIIRGLRDDHSDEIGLLILYRRFLEHRSEAAHWRLVEFMEQYGPFLIRARELKRRVAGFTTISFRRLTEGMASHLMEILQNEGFEAVANAVRRSTVNAQAQKAMNIRDYREIRYDLLPDLRRTRDVPGDMFVETISDFVSKYNVENARRREQKKAAPANVTTEQLLKFMELHNASVVGALLCAYGSCREPREPEPQPEAVDDDLTPGPDGAMESEE